MSGQVPTICSVDALLVEPGVPLRDRLDQARKERPHLEAVIEVQRRRAPNRWQPHPYVLAACSRSRRSVVAGRNGHGRRSACGSSATLGEHGQSAMLGDARAVGYRMPPGIGRACTDAPALFARILAPVGNATNCMMTDYLVVDRLEKRFTSHGRAAFRDITLLGPPGRIRRADRAVRLRQIDPAAHHGRTVRADRRRRAAQRRSDRPIRAPR